MAVRYVSLSRHQYRRHLSLRNGCYPALHPPHRHVLPGLSSGGIVDERGSSVVDTVSRRILRKENPSIKHSGKLMALGRDGSRTCERSKFFMVSGDGICGRFSTLQLYSVPLLLPTLILGSLNLFEIGLLSLFKLQDRPHRSPRIAIRCLQNSTRKSCHSAIVAHNVALPDCSCPRK